MAENKLPRRTALKVARAAHECWVHSATTAPWADTRTQQAWIDVVQVVADELGWAQSRPEFWPPSLGDVWQDDSGVRWICVDPENGELICLASGKASYGYEGAWEKYGPFTFVLKVEPTEEEGPF